MDLSEAIEWLARANASRCRPRRFEDIDATLPYFRVREGKIEAFNYATHDNADRMPYVARWLENRVFPAVGASVDGYYNIQLHDSYTYLGDRKNYEGVLCFGKDKSDVGPAMLPDCYQIGDWGGKYRRRIDPYAWEEKRDTVGFYGTTTGDRDPARNERIAACVWAIDKPWCDFKITGIAQMSADAALRAVPRFREVVSQRVPLEQQFKNKYMLIVDGNVSKWDVDCFFSNSMAFALPSRNMLWYYPFLQEGEHYAAATLDTLRSRFDYYQANAREARRVVECANRLAARLFKEETAREYAISLFRAIAENK